MGARRMVTKEMKGRYQRGSRRERSAILDELCALTGWHRDHARKAIRAAPAPGQPRVPRKAREPVVKYGEAVLAALRVCWATLDGLVIYQRQDRYDFEVVSRLVQERTGGALPSTLGEREDWLDRMVEANGITDLPGSFSITQVIVEVDKGSKHFETYWRTASGFAHGRQWSQLNALVRSEPVPIGPGVAAATVENDMGRVFWGAAAAYELAQTAIGSYRDACRAPRRR